VVQGLDSNPSVRHKATYNRQTAERALMTGTPELDPNLVAAEVFHQLIKDTGKFLSSPMRNFFNRISDAIKKDLQPYLGRVDGFSQV
jgi:hypothetical protein